MLEYFEVLLRKETGIPQRGRELPKEDICARRSTSYPEWRVIKARLPELQANLGRPEAH